MTEMAVAALRRQQACQAEERSRLGFDADRWYGKMVKRAGLPMIRFHDLRHTAATLLLERGVNPKVVSEMLGHASVAVTLTLYGLSRRICSGKRR